MMCSIILEQVSIHSIKQKLTRFESQFGNQIVQCDLH